MDFQQGKYPSVKLIQFKVNRAPLIFHYPLRWFTKLAENYRFLYVFVQHHKILACCWRRESVILVITNHDQIQKRKISVMLLVQRNFCRFSTLIFRLSDKQLRGQQSPPCLTATILATQSGFELLSLRLWNLLSKIFCRKERYKLNVHFKSIGSDHI